MLTNPLVSVALFFYCFFLATRPFSLLTFYLHSFNFRLLCFTFALISLWWWSWWWSWWWWSKRWWRVSCFCFILLLARCWCRVTTRPSCLLIFRLQIINFLRWSSSWLLLWLICLHRFIRWRSWLLLFRSPPRTTS